MADVIKFDTEGKTPNEVVKENLKSIKKELVHNQDMIGSDDKREDDVLWRGIQAILNTMTTYGL